MRRNDIIAVLTLSVVIALGVIAVGASAFNSSSAGPRRYPPRGAAAIAAASQLSSPGQVSGPGHIGPPGQVSPPGHVSGPGHVGPPGQISPPGHLSGPGHVGPPGQTRGTCGADENYGFETGAPDTNDIPCWTVVDQAGGSGSWCLQTGTAPPSGVCSGDFITVPSPPQGAQAAMTNQSGPGSHVLYRCGTLRSASVSFQLYLANAAEAYVNAATLSFAGDANQQFRADVVDPAAMAADPFTVAPDAILASLYQTAPGDALVSGYALVTRDVASLVHRDVCLRFAEVDNELFFHAGVDDVFVSLKPAAGSQRKSAVSCARDANSGFETGVVGSNAIPCWTVADAANGSGSWCEQSGTSPPQGDCAGDNFPVPEPSEGVHAVMTNQSGPGSSVLYQCGVLRSPTVSFDVAVANEAGVFVPGATLSFETETNQQFRADIVAADAMSGDAFTVAPADILDVLYQTQPGDPTITPYARVSRDVSALVGNRVCVRFAAVQTLFFQHAGIDNVAVDLRPMIR